jgi:hypothetical protein
MARKMCEHCGKNPAGAYGGPCAQCASKRPESRAVMPGVPSNRSRSTPIVTECDIDGCDCGGDD